MNPKGSYCFLSDLEWESKINQAGIVAEKCCLCPRFCKINRLNNQTGFCSATQKMHISSIFPHHGEEPPISGTGGSGTIFFTHCTLKCVFCQNWQISQENEGQAYTTVQLSDAMLDMQERGCHNINLVTPTHYIPWIVESIYTASKKGLYLPIVYNTSGYESSETIKILKGIIDIFLPDMKYGDKKSAILYSQSENYIKSNQEAILQMFRQVGPLTCDNNAIAKKGIIIRHLVLPNNAASSEKIIHWLTDHFDPADITVSVMAQYHPTYKADQYLELRRGVSKDEYTKVVNLFQKNGFDGYFQDIDSIDQSFLINFKTRKNKALTGDSFDWEQ